MLDPMQKKNWITKWFVMCVFWVRIKNLFDEWKTSSGFKAPLFNVPVFLFLR